MPVLSWAHSKYWRQRANPVVAPPPSFGGYPLWQSAVIVGSWAGIMQSWWERACEAFRWARRAWGWSNMLRADLAIVVPTWERLTLDQRRAVWAAVRVVQSDAWLAAQAAVFDTSRAEKFNEIEEWAKLGHALRSSRGLAENTWRHLRALHALQALDLSNPDRNLLIELAYHEFADSGRGKPERMQ